MIPFIMRLFGIHCPDGPITFVDSSYDLPFTVQDIVPENNFQNNFQNNSQNNFQPISYNNNINQYSEFDRERHIDNIKMSQNV